MKSLLLGFVIMMASIVVVATPPTALAAGNSVTIRGKVTDGGVPVKNTPVNILANGKSLPSPSTDSNGTYSMKTDRTTVPKGSIIIVTIDRDGDGIPEVKIKLKAPGGNIIIVNITTNSHNIPEYDWLGGVVAASAGLGFVAWHHRRQHVG